MTSARRVAERVSALLTRMVQATEALSAVLIIVILVCNAAQIFFRYVLVRPLGFTEETMRYSMVWVAFLAGSALVFRREHMAVSPFEHRRLARLRPVANAINMISTAVFAGLLIRYGFPLALRNGTELSPSAQIPMIYPYIAVPIGGVLILFYAVFLLFVPSTPRLDDAEEDMRP